MSEHNSNLSLEDFTESSDPHSNNVQSNKEPSPDSQPEQPELSDHAIESLADRPDPSTAGGALQAAHEIGRTALQPMLQECSAPHKTVRRPGGQGHPPAENIVDDLTALRVATGRPMHRIFDDFVELVFQSLRATPDQAAYQAAIEPYAFDSDGSRRDDSPAMQFVNAFSTLVIKTTEGRLDILGDVYHMLGVNHEHFGQYFTPHNLAHAMTEMAGTVASPTDSSSEGFGRGDRSEEALEARPIRGDTAGCGSGRLIIYHANRIPDAFFVGIDIDATAAKITAINLALLNVDAQVLHGNALTMDIRQEFGVHHDPVHGGLITVGANNNTNNSSSPGATS